MRSTFKFCMQLPNEEFATALVLMQKWLKELHPTAEVTARPLRQDLGEFRLSGSKKCISAFKSWSTSFPHETNAFSHYFVENPLRKEYDDLYLKMQLERQSEMYNTNE